MARPADGHTARLARIAPSILRPTYLAACPAGRAVRAGLDLLADYMSGMYGAIGDGWRCRPPDVRRGQCLDLAT